MKERLLDLLQGRRTPEDVADWATPWITDVEPEVDDEVVWEALLLLAGADLRTGPDTYLHGDLDFQAWLDEFEAADAPPRTDQ